MIEPGQPAPDFELPDQDGNPARLSELRGRRVVLYFYPKAATPGGIRSRSSDLVATVKAREDLRRSYERIRVARTLQA
jgi:peroxiredoxin